MSQLNCSIHELFSNCNKSVSVLGQQLNIAAVQLTHWSIDNCVSFAFVMHSNVNMDALYGEHAVEHALQNALVALLAEHHYVDASNALQNATLEFAESGMQEYANAVLMDCYSAAVFAALCNDCIHAQYALQQNNAA
jgi:UDP-N-acetylmuramate-alanine ligase